MKKRNTIYIILFFLLTNLVSLSCKNEKAKNEGQETQKRQIPKIDNREGSLKIDGDDITFNLVSQLGIDFSRKFPNIKNNINFSSSKLALASLENGEVDIVMTSLPKEEITKMQLEYKPLATDMLVLITSFYNTEIQTLAMRGVSKESLAKLLTANIKNWKQVHPQIESIDPILIYTPALNSATTEHISRIFNVNPKNLKASFSMTENDVISNVMNAPISLGLVSHTLAYDPNSLVRRSGLYIIGIDVNNNKNLEDKELIFDDISTLRDGLRKHNLHNDFIRQHYLIYNPKSKNIETIKLFIEHISPLIDEYAARNHFLNTKIN